MRHLKKVKKLGLKKSHRTALLKNLASSLIIHGKIKTTELRAKTLASLFGRLMATVLRKETREAIRSLPNFCNIKAAQFKIIGELKPKYKGKTSGFTRITRLGQRKGDNASLVQIELI